MNRALLLVAALLLVGRDSARPESFGWPIDIKPALSSTFGETRSTAFHAGIDIKTWGKTGYAVRALGDGEVLRLRTSPWGYGKVVYQKLADGRVLVYGHLRDFAPELAARVEAAQQEKGQYSVDLWFEAGELPVTRGEQIAWTGESGAGPPHLHLELRDADHRPLNPLLHGFSVEDSTPPTLQAIALIPLGRESWVDGGHEPAVFALGWNRKSRIFSAHRVVVAHGRIGMGAKIYDRADGAPNKLAPYRAELRVDGAPVFASAYGRYAYADAHQMDLDRMRLEFGGGNGFFFNLFQRPGNRLEFYTHDAGDGSLDCGERGDGFFLNKGIHQVEVMAEDVAGNQSRARFRIRVDDPPTVSARILGGGKVLRAEVRDGDDARVEVELARLHGGEQWKVVETEKVEIGDLEWQLQGDARLWRVRVTDGAGSERFSTCALPAEDRDEELGLTVEKRIHADFAELAIRVDQLLRTAPQVRIGGEELEVRQTELREYRVDVELRDGDGKEVEVAIEATGRNGSAVHKKICLEQRAVRPKEEIRLVFGAGEAELVFDANSAYQVCFPQGERFVLEMIEGFAGPGIGYAFAPAEISFDRKVEVWLEIPKGDVAAAKFGVYADSGDGTWSLVGNELEADGRRVGARIRRLGRYALLADETPPVIDALSPVPGAVIAARRPRLAARIDDEGAGIGREEDIDLELDGERMIGEYDPEAKRVAHQVGEELPPGPHTLVVRVRDMSGNEKVARVEFTVE